MYVLFAIVVAPVFFLLVLWAAVMVHRLYFPGRAMPFERPFTARSRRGGEGSKQDALVGVREIRAEQRRRMREHAEVSYHYAGWGSGSVPVDWMEDVWERRN